MSPRNIPLVLATILLWHQAMAQTLPSAPTGNAVKNGTFAETYDTANLWRGIDHDGFLAGHTSQVKALDDQGNISPQTMPVGVSIGDLNGDKLNDIVSADPLGYLRMYFNEGSANEPKFGAGEISLPFLARPDGSAPWMPNFGDMKDQKAYTSFGTDYNQWLFQWSRRRQVPRPYLATGARGVPDLWVGNYFGEILFFRNEGTANSPAFGQPRDFNAAILPTMPDPKTRWGNIFSPAYADITGDGLPELLVAEGSYSANNVHFLANAGAADRPAFDAAKRTPIALGEGRQQLGVAIADANGDGKSDILVSDRAGRIAVHLRPSDWVPGREFPFSGYLSRGGGLNKAFDQSLPFGDGITTVAAGDMNGDNLFDIVVGRTNGRIAWSANRGTATEPKFEAPAEIKSSAQAAAISRLPEKWLVDAGQSRGNFGGYITVVSGADDPSVSDRGRKVVRLGFEPLPNKIIKRPDAIFPGTPKLNMAFDETGLDNIFRLGLNFDDFVPDGATRRMREAPSNAYLLRQKINPMAIGKTYTLSFDVKGSRAANGRVLLGWRGFKKLAEDKIVRGERGAVERRREVISGTEVETADFSISGSWSTVSKEFRIAFKKDPALNKEPATSEAILEIYCELAPPDSVVYIDNVKLEPKGS